MSFEFFLENVTDPTGRLSAVDFYEISDLSPEELGLFASAWYPLSVERQRDIASTMVELAEDNPELDFTAIFKLCLNGDDEPLLKVAMDGLWEHDDRSVIPELVDVLRSENRYETAHACGELGEEEAVPHLILLLEDDDSEVQLAGIGALGKIGGPLAKKVLQSLVRDGDANLEEAARMELEDLEFDEDPQGYLGES